MAEGTEVDRAGLAKWVIGFSFLVIIVIGGLAIGYAVQCSKTADPAAAVKDILSMLLPVIGAWVGTVIAFYFGRENFESASRSSANLVRQLTPDDKLKAVIIRDAMLPISKAVTFTLDKPEKDVKVKADLVDNKLEKEKKERLPILDDKGCIKYMAHRSMFDRFLVKNTDKLQEVTLQDMLDDVAFKTYLVEGFATVAPTDTFSDAKEKMAKDSKCSDVFATEDGTAKTKVLGWVTNIDIEERSKV